MKRIMCAAFILTALYIHATPEKINASVECITDNYSYERYFIKGIDGVDREVKILSLDEYCFLTNRLEAAWKLVNSTHENRVKVHGQKVNTYVDTENAEKVTEYKDGYRHFEKMVIKTGAVRKQIDGTAKKTQTNQRRPSNISERQWKASIEREAAKKAAQREVNVIYNANDGTTKEVK